MLLASAAAAPQLLASLSRDGELRTWDVAAGACTSASASQATSLVSARHPQAAKRSHSAAGVSHTACFAGRRRPAPREP